MGFDQSWVLSPALWSFSGTPPFSGAKHPKGCWSVITTLSFGIARRWSLEGVSLLLGCSLWRKTTVGVSRGSWMGVSEFLAGGVSSHYFSFLDSSLWGPTGSAVMDRYILWGITGMKKEGGKKNHQRESSSSFILSLHMDCVQAERQSCLAHESHL